MKRIALATALSVLLPATAPADNPVEVGHVRWGRDLGAAFKASQQTRRPVLVLFQEVPGCAGCQQFGRTVLTNPLLVEAIEDEFLPVLVYNNKPEDESILQRFKEPAWNYQVVRFLDARAGDLIPRKDRVWSLGALSGRMIEALRAAKRPVPKYLQALHAETATDRLAASAFAMHCFWTGEVALGGVDGVVTTEAGWLEGKEVTRVVYDPTRISLPALAAKARAAKCATKVYAPADGASGLQGFETGVLDERYRKAQASDQKKQIEHWKAIHALPGIIDMQKTKINALAPSNRTAALEWLSPRQQSALRTLEQAAGGTDD